MEVVFKINLLIKVEMHEVLFSLQLFHINQHYHHHQEVKLYKNAREREKYVPAYIIFNCVQSGIWDINIRIEFS